MTTVGRAARVTLILLATSTLTPACAGRGHTDAPDAEAFCRARETWGCARLQVAAVNCAGSPPYTSEQYDACRAAIPGDCSGVRFAEGCFPTKVATDACIDALSNMENICIPESVIPECNICS